MADYYNKFVAIDVETTAKSPYPLKKNGKSFGAWPFFGENEVVLGGIYETQFGEQFQFFNWMDLKSENDPGIDDEHGQFIVATCHGQFDFHHIRRWCPEFIRRLFKYGLVWDVQIAEYILTAQQHTMASLDELLAKYGLPLKSEDIKEHFESGKGADSIEPSKLKEYLEWDLKGTLQVAQQQMARANPKQIKLILQMGEALKAATEMEWNGFEVDELALSQLDEALDAEISRLEGFLIEYLASFFSVPEEAINLNSRQMWSVYLFGGTYEFKWKGYEGFYKTGPKAGEPKPKSISFIHKGAPIRRSINPEMGKDGYFLVDESVLEKLAPLDRVASVLLQYKRKSKLRNTYVSNIMANSSASFDGRLHHNLNLTVASTGRLSCSDPNMQNIPTEEKGLRSCFISRWGNDGAIIEADYKALEMIGFATVNQDPVLIDDLNSGRDPHIETGKQVFPGRDMSEVERRQVKGVNFGTIYGGGVAAVADNAGVEHKLCKAIQQALRSRYSVGFKTAKDRLGPLYIEPVGTGRKYCVNGEYTKTMNYPVQGFSTGDLVPTVMGVLYAKLQDSDELRETCLLINQEHDKILFDCRLDMLPMALPFIRETMEAAPEMMKEIYGVEMPCRTPVSIKVGTNMGSMLKVE